VWLGWVLAAVCVGLPVGVWAQTAEKAVAPTEPPLAQLSTAEAERFHLLTQELRCVVCQNENLADSTAPLAQDLKREIREQMAAGRSDGDIKAFLVARYGDFITYRPPVRAGTLLLWGGPLLFVGVAGWLWLRNRSAARGRVEPVEKSLGENG
jgi:cytochrome c-type biogenesis protein CcmH